MYHKSPIYRRKGLDGVGTRPHSHLTACWPTAAICNHQRAEFWSILMFLMLQPDTVFPSLAGSFARKVMQPECGWWDAPTSDLESGASVSHGGQCNITFLYSKDHLLHAVWSAEQGYSLTWPRLRMVLWCGLGYVHAGLPFILSLPESFRAFFSA